MKNLIRKYLNKLKSYEGEPIPLKDLHKWNSKYIQKKKKYSYNEIQKITEDLLDELENYGLVRKSENSIIPSHPFCVEANLSVTRTGIAFAEGDFPKDIFISGKNRNDAKHRDTVLIELTGKSREKFEGRVIDIIRHFSTFFTAKIIETMKDSYLIELIDLPDHPFGALVSEAKLKKGEYIVAEQMPQSIRVAVPKSALNRNDYPYRQLDVYRLHEKYKPDSIQTDIDRIILKYNLPFQYTNNYHLSKKDLKKKVKEEFKNRKRVNLTRLFTFTIDGKHAKDFDDAISTIKNDNGYTLYVHIADVSFFVEKNSDLNKEAFTRGNSYYLGNRVIPMLPPVLSEDFCSLKPKTKRLAFTVEMHFNNNGELQLYYFYKSIIYVNKRFTYEEANANMEQSRSALKDTWELAQKLTHNRADAGRIDLNLIDPEVIYNKNGGIDRIAPGRRLNSHRLIEECMLSANYCAADLAAENTIPSLFRNHPHPEPSNLESINAVLHSLGIKQTLKKITAEEIKKIMHNVTGTKAERIFHYLILRTFSPAVYSPENNGHWALKMENYTHFTSPIRRYADLIVHRQIHSWIDHSILPYNPGDLTFAGKETSRLERIALEAERALMRLNAIRFMRKEDSKKAQTGIFTGYNQLGLIILLEEWNIEGILPVSEITKSGSIPVINEYTVNLDKYQRSLSIGDSISVGLKEVNWDEIKIFFQIDESSSFH